VRIKKRADRTNYGGHGPSNAALVGKKKKVTRNQTEKRNKAFAGGLRHTPREKKNEKLHAYLGLKQTEVKDQSEGKGMGGTAQRKVTRKEERRYRKEKFKGERESIAHRPCYSRLVIV